jgi:hypothetical protein
MHSKVKLNDFINQLNEDYGPSEMIPDVNRQQMGMKTEVPSTPSSVNDIMSKHYRSDVSPENIPYPLNDFDNIAADAYVNIQNLEDLLKIAKTNAVIKNKKSIDSITKELLKLKKNLVDISGKVVKIK